MAKKPAQTAAVVAAAINLALLSAIATATTVEPYFMQAPVAELKPLQDAGLIDVNPDAQFAKDGDLNFPAARVNETGLKYLAENQPAAAPAPVAQAAWTAPAAPAVAAPAPVAAAPAASFEIFKFALPAPKRVGGSGGARPEKFPFSKMEVGDAIFVEATAAVPNPFKKYASTVNSATQRYATEDTTKPQAANRKGRMVHPKIIHRKFAIRLIEDGATIGKPGKTGAVIGRVA